MNLVNGVLWTDIKCSTFGNCLEIRLTHSRKPRLLQKFRRRQLKVQQNPDSIRKSSRLVSPRPPHVAKEIGVVTAGVRRRHPLYGLLLLPPPVAPLKTLQDDERLGPSDRTASAVWGHQRVRGQNLVRKSQRNPRRGVQCTKGGLASHSEWFSSILQFVSHVYTNYFWYRLPHFED